MEIVHRHTIHRGTVPRRISIAAEPYCGGFRSPRYCTTADYDHRRTIPRRISIAAVPYRGGFLPDFKKAIAVVPYRGGFRSPRYRTAANFDRRGTVPRRIVANLNISTKLKNLEK